jgi:hypothetical protein
VPDSLALAQPVSMSPTGYGETSADLQADRDVDVYRLVATVTGRIQVEQYTAPGSTLTGRVSVYDAAGNLLARGDDGRVGLNDLATFAAVAGQTYYLQAAADPAADPATNHGRYVLFFGPDVGGTLQAPQPLPSFGSGSLAGIIPVPDHQDVYRLDASVNGVLHLQVRADPDSGLQATVAVLDAQGREVAGGDGSGSAQLLLAEGQAYYVEVGDADVGVGDYQLAFTVDAFGLIIPAGGGDTAGNFHPPAPEREAQAGFGFLAATEVAVRTSVDLLPVQESALAVVATLLVGGSAPAPGGGVVDDDAEEEGLGWVGWFDGEAEEAGVAAAAPTERMAQAALQSGVDEAFRRLLPDARDRLLELDPEPTAADPIRSVLESVFREWPGRVAGAVAAGWQRLADRALPVLRETAVWLEQVLLPRADREVPDIPAAEDDPPSASGPEAGAEADEAAGLLLAALFLAGLGPAERRSGSRLPAVTQPTSGEPGA